MALAVQTTYVITCDGPRHKENPPGLDPANRHGWLFASLEAYGLTAAAQGCFCSPACASDYCLALASGAAELPAI